MSRIYSHFSAVSHRSSNLFGGSRAGYSYSGADVSEQLAQLVSQVTELTSAISGKAGGSAFQTLLGGTSLGGSLTGGGGFSFGSILKDIFPVGGLISGIAGLFSSAPTPPPLNQYDAPPSLNFDAVLGSDGTLSQNSVDQYGYSRAASTGLDLADAANGPYSPYTRASNGSLVPVAGDPVTRYSGALNLPEIVNAVSSPQPAASANASTVPPAASPGSNIPTAPSGAASIPTFDAQWFNDHGNLIASAVRNQLLNLHPIVDAINDLSA